MADDTPPKKPVILTRKELYDRVWSSPMTKLAAEFGISDAGLIKICKRLDVPRPPQGHWAKKAAGKKVRQLPLREPKDGTPPSATISPTPPPEPPPALSKETAAKMEAVRDDVAMIPVPERLLRPHPVVAGWIAKRADQRREARERRRLLGHAYDPGEFTEIERREHRIYDALFKGVERHGGKVHEGTPRGRIVEMGKEKIEFLIRQKQKQIRRPPTIEEKKQSWNRDKELIYQTITTDMLILEIKSGLPGRLRSKWLETLEKPLEDMLPDIVATFIGAGPLLLQQRLEREEEHRRYEAAAEKRREAERRRKQDDNRWRLFRRFASKAQDVAEARRLLAALKNHEADSLMMVGERSVGEWIEWVEQRITHDDPLLMEPKDIFSSLAAVSEWNYRPED
jgi:hypothetical protein